MNVRIKDKENLQIQWDDESVSIISCIDLRRACPCAVCSTERDNEDGHHFKIYRDNQLIIKSLQIVGNYALGITWKDGHNTGIYEFAYLKKLSEMEKTL
jgi:DUF971 family protein